MKQLTLTGDVYYTHFQNAYSSINDPTNPSAFDQVAQGDAVTKGFEGEANVYLTRGLSFYINGTAGTGKYVSQMIPNSKGVLATNPNYNLWIANTPSDTEALGLTYQQKHFEVGIFDKRIGSMWNDYKNSNSITFNQVIPIDPFSVTNFYFNYVLASGSRFSQSKVRFSVNNLFDSHNIVGVTQFATTGTAYNPTAADQLTLLPGRSFTVTVTPAFSPRR